MRKGYLQEWDGDRYVAHHRLVMERSIGRPLLDSEVVHHVNHDKLDNRIENLELVVDRAAHRRMHKGEKHPPRPWQEKPLAPCPVCGEPFKPKRRDGRDTVTCSYSCSNRLRPRGIAEQRG